MRERDSVRSSGTLYPDGPPPHGRMHARDDVLVADTGHALWPEKIRHRVSEKNSVVPDEMLLTFDSVEMLAHGFSIPLDIDFGDLTLTLFVGDQPQASYSVAHLLQARAPLLVRRGTRAIFAPPRQHYYWELSRHPRAEGKGRTVYHVAVAYTTEDYEAWSESARWRGQLGQ